MTRKKTKRKSSSKQPAKMTGKRSKTRSGRSESKAKSKSTSKSKSSSKSHSKTRTAHRLRLSYKKLTQTLPKSWIAFRTTAELDPVSGSIGQQRAMEAIAVGLEITTRGFNIYAAGEAGSGKTSTLESLLEKRAAQEPVPDDLVYVTNFNRPERPTPLFLPAGQGKKLKKDMETLVTDLRRLVPQALSEGSFGHIKASLLSRVRREAAKLTEKTSAAAQKLGLRLEEEGDGMRVVPEIDGEPLDNETFERLSAAQKRKIESRMVEFQKHMDAHAYGRRQLEREHLERLSEAQVRAITPLVEEALAEISKRYTSKDGPLKHYLQQVKKHILDHHRVFLPEEEGEETVMEKHGELRGQLKLYEVNLLCDRSDDTGAPVVFERVPNSANLCGCVEYRPQNGALTTDHTMIRAGALHAAHGGYLIVQAVDLLTCPSAWGCLKRALRHKETRVEEAAGLTEGQQRLAGTMKPEPAPIDVKVILVGSRELYYLLKTQDEDFGRLFKIKADFEPSMVRNKENVNKLAAFLGTVCRRESYLPLHRSGLSRLVEIASRRVEDQNRMTTHQAELLDVLAEANYFACGDNARAVRAEDVDRTLDEIRKRHGAVADAILREIGDGSIIIRTSGMAVGQINGIAIYDLAGVSFGMPVRITARVYAGRRGVVNIDREVNLSGAIHDKGSLILVGYMGGRYAHAQTLGLSASITFEQSYDEIDGDSASSAELYALLSALSGRPIRQGISVTGSVNQLGEVQPIGGVNHKIEGIFRVCEQRGLTGEEGVMIPAANMKNLMLSRHVIDAVRKGRFNIYAVSSIDEGIEVLTDVVAGTRDKNGKWTQGSINALVQKRLSDLQTVVRQEGVETTLDEKI